MTFPWIKALHYIGLAALLGGPAFWYLVWRPALFKVQSEGAGLSRSDAVFAATTRGVMTAGLVLFLATGILDIMRAAREVFGLLYWEDFVFFATYSTIGQVILARLAVGLVFFLTGLRLSTRRTTVSWIAPLAAGLGAIVLISVVSHQAGKETVTPLVADVIHLAATSIWGGGLLYFALVPWGMLRTEPDGGDRLSHLSSLFSTVGTLAVVVVSATGIYMSLQQFYSPLALTRTTYGMSLLRKLAGFGLVLAVAAAHHFAFVPRMRAGSDAGDREKVQRVGTWFVRLVRAEALLVVLVLVATGFLTTQMPPTSPVGLVDVASEEGTFPGGRYNLTLLPRDQGQILFELLVEDEAGLPLALNRAELDLTMLDHYMPPYILPMEEEMPGVYRATALLSMGGRWHVTTILDWAGGNSHSFVIEFDTLSSFRDVQQQRRYDWRAIGQKRWGWVLFVLYGGLTVAGAAALFYATRPPHRSALLLTLGILLLTGGGAMLARVAEVPGPYSYRINPVRRTEAVMRRGEELYRAHCLICHGETGRGDGPAGLSVNPRPADFTKPQGIDDHSDGELFWYISRGIAGSSMPAFENILSEEERWILVHYIRSFSEAAR